MVSCKEAVDFYIKVLRELGRDVPKYQFKVDNGKICMGHVWGEGVNEVQWAMMWHTPEEFSKLARMRSLNPAPVKKVGTRFIEVDRESL